MVEKLCSIFQHMVDHYIDDIMILLYMTTRNKLTNGVVHFSVRISNFE